MIYISAPSVSIPASDYGYIYTSDWAMYVAVFPNISKPTYMTYLFRAPIEHTMGICK